MVWLLDLDTAMQIDLLVAWSQIFLKSSLDTHPLLEIPEKKPKYIKVLDSTRVLGRPSASITVCNVLTKISDL